MSAKGHASRHHTISLCPTAAVTREVSRRRPRTAVDLDGTYSGSSRWGEVLQTRRVEPELMPSGHKPAELTRRANEVAQARLHKLRRPCNLHIIMQRHQDAARKARISTHTLQHALHGCCEAKRPEGAAVRAVTQREEAHPAIRTKCSRSHSKQISAKEISAKFPVAELRRENRRSSDSKHSLLRSTP